MHVPSTVAFDIKRPWPQRTAGGLGTQLYGRFYWPTWITIWHEDPETDGTDDSCGWFMRPRHGDLAMLETIRKEFAFHWTWGDADQGWFDPVTGFPKKSNAGIMLDMFAVASRRFYAGRLDRHGWRRSQRFMRRHLFEILQFAEGGADNMQDAIEQKHGPSPQDERIARFAAVVYGCLLRWNRPWYRHPRWHVWHWRIQVHPVQRFKRWAFSRCEKCGKGFRWGYSPVSHSWHGTGPLWFRSERGVVHSDCARPTDEACAVAKSNA